MKKQHYFTPILLLCAFALHATHNRSGEIAFRKTGGLGVEATVFTYTKASSVAADRDTLTICWGDGTCDKIARTNNNGVIIGPDLKKNTYTGTHTYAVEGVYHIWMTDVNRTGNILNINPPNSDNIPFHLEATVRLMPDAAASMQSPVFLEPPVDVAYTFQPFVHVPNAFDPDGDSLAYELVTPMAEPGLVVPNYFFPNEIAPSDDNKIFFNEVTGAFYWDSPVLPGHYGIAILVKSYHNGILVETTLRDMSIDVLPEANHPPQIVIAPNLDPDAVVEVAVGQTVNIAMSASDPDPGQNLTLTATGGPMEGMFQEKATFTATSNTGVFNWKVTPEYLRNQPYQVVFKAKDDLFGYGLASTRIARFRVIESVRQQEPNLGLLSIAPNPASGQINIAWPETLTGAATLRMLDAQGRLVKTALLSSGTNQKSLELTALPPGLYFIEIQTAEGKKLSGKIVRI